MHHRQQGAVSFLQPARHVRIHPETRARVVRDLGDGTVFGALPVPVYRAERLSRKDLERMGLDNAVEALEQSGLRYAEHPSPLRAGKSAKSVFIRTPMRSRAFAPFRPATRLRRIRIANSRG